MEDSTSSLKIVASCIPGLEHVTVQECREKLAVKAKREDQRGRVSFTWSLNSMGQLKALRSVHHLWVIVGEINDFLKDEDSNEKIFKGLEELPSRLSWENPLTARGNFRAISKPAEAEHDKTEDEPHTQSEICGRGQCSGDKEEDKTGLSPTEQGSTTKLEVGMTGIEKTIKFRVTCSRTGKHKFNSMEAAKWMGSGVKEIFGWQVDLENFDIEVLTFIFEKNITVAIRLTEESKHKRNIAHFGPTTLRSTTSYCMLKLANIKPGDIVCDPMCGTGSISLEAANSFSMSFQLAGEIHPEGCENAGQNFESLCTNQGKDKSKSNYSLPFTVFRWDACHLPLRSETVDVIVCDLPFGKKMGRKAQNKILYTNALKEMGRVCRSGISRAVLITQHKQAIIFALKQCNYLWKRRNLFNINMGGLNVGVYVLARKSKKKRKFKDIEEGTNDSSDEKDELSDDDKTLEN